MLHVAFACSAHSYAKQVSCNPKKSPIFNSALMFDLFEAVDFGDTVTPCMVICLGSGRFWLAVFDVLIFMLDMQVEER